MNTDLIEQVLAASPAADTVVLQTHSAATNVRWANSELTTNGQTETSEITVIAFHESAAGVSTGSVTQSAADLDPRELAHRAHAVAVAATPAWDAMPLPTATAAPTGDWTAPTPTVEPHQIADVIAQLGQEMAIDYDRQLLHFGYLEQDQTAYWLATSAGLRLRFDQPSARLEMTVQSSDRQRSTWEGYAGSNLANASIADLASSARQRLSWQERTAKLPPGRYPVLLTAGATADLMIDLLWGADARAAAQGRSVFRAGPGQTKIGHRVSQRALTLRSDPAMADQPGLPFLATTVSDDSSSVFDNGLALVATDWIRDGVLTSLVSSRAVAQQTGVPLALQPDNLALEADGQGSLADLIARTERAILVTCTWYNRMVDPAEHLVTGLTRDGVYLVEHGEVTSALPNYRFNDSPFALLDRITDASRAEPTMPREMGDYFTRVTMPALAVADFNLSSSSDAV